MTRIAVVGDTHIPNREAEIPDAFRERIASADRVVHVGDFTTAEVLDEVDRLAGGDLIAVAGNMDPGALGLASVETFKADGVEFAVTHGTGPLEGYQERVAGIIREAGGSVGIAGHTHEPLDCVVGGVRLLNPGSLTGAAPATRATMFTLDVSDGTVEAILHRA